MSAKNNDNHNRFRSRTIAFRVSPEEDEQINIAVSLSGMTKQDYITYKLLDRTINVTAIPAIKAKPIIDIVVGVTDFDKVMLHNEQLRQVGIFYRGSDVERQFLYVMGDMENDTRTHHIHIVKWNGTEWKNYIHFRDYLNDNENMALQYQKVKEELESKYADDRVAYTNGKQDMIDLILDNQ